MASGPLFLLQMTYWWSRNVSKHLSLRKKQWTAQKSSHWTHDIPHINRYVFATNRRSSAHTPPVPLPHFAELLVLSDQHIIHSIDNTAVLSQEWSYGKWKYHLAADCSTTSSIVSCCHQRLDICWYTIFSAVYSCHLICKCHSWHLFERKPLHSTTDPPSINGDIFNKALIRQSIRIANRTWALKEHACWTTRCNNIVRAFAWLKTDKNQTKGTEWSEQTSSFSFVVIEAKLTEINVAWHQLLSISIAAHEKCAMH